MVMHGPLKLKYLGMMLVFGSVFFSDAIRCQNTSSDPEGLALDNKTPTWKEVVSIYSELAEDSPKASFFEAGKSDVGRPVHAMFVGKGGQEIKDLESLQAYRQSHPERLGLLINNAIHPGEPCGVDASINWLRTLLSDKSNLNELTATIDIVIIPMYNVGGALNRNCCTRTNQDGPEEYGFRGNARNLDLNRDFIKMDSKNAFAFVSLFHAFAPNLFIDTHTTNGADYPYSMTLISTQHNKAGPVLGPFIQNEMEPFLYGFMAEQEQPMCPYVFTKGETPDDGLIGFLETPRYSTGYSVLFGCLGLTSEAHMLKPFPERVKATMTLFDGVVQFMKTRHNEILELKGLELDRCFRSDSLPVHWEHDPDQYDPITFNGYEARKEISSVTGDIRLKYDRKKTWTNEIPFYNHYNASQYGHIPDHFVIPQAWHQVIERMQHNGVIMGRFEKDTLLNMEVTYIQGFRSTNNPYEGHHLNSFDSLEIRIEPVQIYAGDFIVESHQPALRYIIEVLDPRGHDSFFRWNFFDSAMQQKEYYSAYVFEETAEEMLKLDDDLRMKFELELANNPELKENARAQLDWLYKASMHYEGSANRYPVFRSLQ